MTPFLSFIEYAKTLDITVSLDKRTYISTAPERLNALSAINNMQNTVWILVSRQTYETSLKLFRTSDVINLKLNIVTNCITEELHNKILLLHRWCLENQMLASPASIDTDTYIRSEIVLLFRKEWLSCESMMDLLTSPRFDNLSV